MLCYIIEVSCVEIRRDRNYSVVKGLKIYDISMGVPGSTFGLALEQNLESPVISVFDLIISSVGHLLLDGFPPGPVDGHQFEDLLILLQGPLLFVDVGPQVIHIFVSQLLPSSIWITIGNTVKLIHKLFPALASVLDQISELLFVFRGPAMAGLCNQPPITAVAHFLSSLRHIFINLFPGNILNIDQFQKFLILFSTPDSLLALIAGCQ